MNSDFFNIDYVSLGRQILRPRHRETNQGSFMNGIMQVFYSLGGLFFSFRESLFYSLSHDSRKISIEKVLNDSFDSQLRRIYIDNVLPEGQQYLYEPTDSRPLHLYEPADNAPVYLYETLEVDVNAVNFVVYLPVALQPADQTALNNIELRINAAVNKYKLDSKNHKLIWIV